MSNNFNDQFDERKNNGEVEQVSKDMFGFTETQEESGSKADKNRAEKVSFTELRQGRKIPRLRKSMVLALITGGIFVFLIMVNLLIKKKEEQRKYFDEQKNIVAVGNDFSLGDLEKRPRQTEIERVEMTENDEFYFKTPPSYTPAPAQRAVSTPSGNSGGGAGSRSSGGYYSDSDLLAIKAQIGKDGGYGLTARTVSYNSPDQMVIDPAGYYGGPPGTMNQIPSREEYTRQRMDDFARLAQMTGGSTGSQGRDSTRYTEAGRYNPNNPQQGSDLFYVNDNCLFPGTIIHAILVSRIDTDYPGPIHARVTENVYDSMTGKNLLIPQGTILQGNYSSSSIGVSKVQVAWESMVVNYGGVAYQVSLGGMAGVDKRGRAGIAGTLDDHYFEWLKAAGIVSLFTMLNSEVTYQTKNQNNPQLRELMDINQGIVNRFGARLMERALDIQPTVRVANGTAVSVAVNAVVNLRPFPAIRAEEKWVRR
jgi:type IV secretion system protein VirB10